MTIEDVGFMYDAQVVAKGHFFQMDELLLQYFVSPQHQTAKFTTLCMFNQKFIPTPIANSIKAHSMEVI